jgi:hypothetical protein
MPSEDRLRDVASRNGPKTRGIKVGASSGPPLVPLCTPPDAEEDLMALFFQIQQIRARPLFVLASEFIDEDVCEEVYRWRKTLKAVAVNDDLDILIQSPGGD